MTMLAIVLVIARVHGMLLLNGFAVMLGALFVLHISNLLPVMLNQLALGIQLISSAYHSPAVASVIKNPLKITSMTIHWDYILIILHQRYLQLKSLVKYN